MQIARTNAHVHNIMYAAQLAKMSPYPLTFIETRFDEEPAVQWVQQQWMICIYVGAAYVLLVHAGKWWMSDKSPWYLRRPLTMWNTGLAVFSILGTLTLLPAMAAGVWGEGVSYTVCQRIVYGSASPPRNLWSLLFVLFKIIELGDTTFVILRKTPLNFLHWYHHLTVMMYCWMQYPGRDGVANWYILLNFFIHSVMYTYYAIKASGYRVTSSVAQVITTLQLTQFVIGILSTLLAFWLKVGGVDCVLSDQSVYLGLAMYFSYLVLFLNFFYKRYCVKK